MLKTITKTYTKKMIYKTSKALTKILIASYLTNEASKDLVKDFFIYKQKNKRLLNELVESNKDVYNLCVKTIEGKNQLNIIEDEQEIEYTSNQLQDKLSLIDTFCKLYSILSEAGIVDLDILLNNVLQDKKVYTEEEVKSILKRFSSEVTVMKYTDNQLDKYL